MMRLAIGKDAQIVHARPIQASGNVQADGLGARRDEQRAERIRSGRRPARSRPRALQRRHARTEEKNRFAARCRTSVRPERDPVFLRRARQIVLRQIRAIARRCRAVRADHRDGPSYPLAAACQPRRGLPRRLRQSRSTPARPSRPGRRRGAVREFLADEQRVAALLHSPARHRIESRCTNASPVFRSKHAWCHGHRTVPPTINPSRAARGSECSVRRSHKTHRRSERARPLRYRHGLPAFHRRADRWRRCRSAGQEVSGGAVIHDCSSSLIPFCARYQRSGCGKKRTPSRASGKTASARSRSGAARLSIQVISVESTHPFQHAAIGLIGQIGTPLVVPGIERG